jgi:hypothetical protein
MARLVTRSVLAAQASMLARIGASEPGGVSRTRIAEAAGLHLSMLSKFEPESPDPREMTWDTVRRLADAFGWDVVCGAPASAAGFTIAPATVAPAEDALGASIRLVGQSAELAAEVRAALADGRISRDEAAAIVSRVAEVVETAESVGAVAAPRAVAG